MSTDELLQEAAQVADGLVYYVHTRHEPGCHALLDTLNLQQLHALAVVLAERVPPPAARPDDGIVDDVVVERAMRGERVSLTRTEQDEAARRMFASGAKVSEVATSLGMSGTKASNMHKRFWKEMWEENAA